MFIRVRGSWYPHDSIDAIVEIGGRLRVDLCNGVKIDLDPIESEKVLKQLNRAAEPTVEATVPPIVTQRISAVEAAVMGLKAQITMSELAKQKARVKSNA